ncbi:unnamed protein product [Amoebophrya sp. A25]|nr:unnamed protein product [Amoebophrya sp. A25]|eukprot:GSA25T00017651001.1
MGSYLSAPVTRKESVEGKSESNPYVADCACTGMQGWRKKMEDAHICLPDLQLANLIDQKEELQDRWKGYCLFSVFDGHGGKAVADFCQKFVPELLIRRNPEDLEALLVQLHHRLDDLLRDEGNSFRNAFGLCEGPPGGPGGFHSTAATPGRGTSTRSTAGGALGRVDPDATGTTSDSTGSNKALTLLQKSIDKDLLGAKSKGSLTQKEATNVMVKMMLLKELKRKNSADSGEKGSASEEEQKRTSGEPGTSNPSSSSTSTATTTDENLNSLEEDRQEQKENNSSSCTTTSSTPTPTTEEEKRRCMLRSLWDLDTQSSAFKCASRLSAISSTSTAASFENEGTVATTSPSSKAQVIPPRSVSHPTPSVKPNVDGIARFIGCTAVQALITPSGEVVVANAGDSRCIIGKRGGIAHALSEDHKPDQERESSRIVSAGGRVEVCRPVAANGRTHHRVNGNLNLSRAIGDLEYKQRQDLPPQEQVIVSTPDVVRYKIQEGDEFLVLACDGVWDMKSNQEVVDFIRGRMRKQMPLKQICEELLDACLADDPRNRGGLGGDNTTVIVVRLKDPLSATSTVS